ncbi:hypothetical protein Ahy_B03g063751 [Arachis hypogaea]|uniref:GRF-type domain-containing protein n=1 Tax=Arachis hypogaea TaxID=3818 RepID=A0A444ZYG0_ARAHY|nr:hypothetical protein Ahy_B03g063751 [Arachis hypogaea]
MMGSGSGGSGGGFPSHSHSSYTSSSAMRRIRQNHEETCFCGLKTLIKKSGTSKNPDRLFHTCARHQKGNHCNFFKWVEENENIAVAEGSRGVPEIEGELDIDYEDWKVKLAWRIGSLEAEVRMASSFFLDRLNPGVGTKFIKLASFLVVAALDPLIVPAEIGVVAVGGAGWGEAVLFPFSFTNLKLVCASL